VVAATFYLIDQYTCDLGDGGIVEARIGGHVWPGARDDRRGVGVAVRKGDPATSLRATPGCRWARRSHGSQAQELCHVMFELAYDDAPCAATAQSALSQPSSPCDHGTAVSRTNSSSSAPSPGHTAILLLSG